MLLLLDLPLPSDLLSFSDPLPPDFLDVLLLLLLPLPLPSDLLPFTDPLLPPSCEAEAWGREAVGSSVGPATLSTTKAGLSVGIACSASSPKT